MAVGFSPTDRACAAILEANSLRISTTAAFSSLRLSVCLATLLEHSLYLAYCWPVRFVHKILPPDTIRQTIGRIGKARTVPPSLWFEWLKGHAEKENWGR